MHLGLHGAWAHRTAMLAVVALHLSGCGEGDPVTPPVSVPLAPPSSPIEVVDQLELAWARQDGDLFASLLHESFTFRFWAADQTQHQIPPHWYREAELAAVERLFAGLPGRDLGFGAAPPVKRCVPILSMEAPTWAEPSQPHPPGTVEQAYEVSMRIEEEGATRPLDVLGVQVLQFVPRTQGGRTIWQLWAWEDKGIPGVRLSAGEVTSWGRLKYVYAPEPLPDLTPRSPDEVIVALAQTWRQRRHGPYGELLATDFTFFFAAEDVDQLGLPASWSRAEELSSASALFTGQRGTTPSGDPQEPVEDVQLTLTSQQLEWLPVVGTSRTRRTYRVSMVVRFIGGGAAAVLSDQQFEVAPIEDGARVRWVLAAWRDYGNQLQPVAGRASPSSSELSTWGWLKALY